MSKKCLIIVDMQNDFITGSLGTAEAVEIVPKVIEKAKKFQGKLIFTMDTHFEDYLSTQEGKLLPVEHCIKGTEGRELEPELDKICREKSCKVYEKPAFGSVSLAKELAEENSREPFDEIQLAGLCTDICVVSNALLLKAYMPEVKISVCKDCCAGVTPEKHKAALAVMESCQIIIKEE